MRAAVAASRLGREPGALVNFAPHLPTYATALSWFANRDPIGGRKWPESAARPGWGPDRNRPGRCRNMTRCWQIAGAFNSLESDPGAMGARLTGAGRDVPLVSGGAVPAGDAARETPRAWSKNRREMIINGL